MNQEKWDRSLKLGAEWMKRSIERDVLALYGVKAPNPDWLLEEAQKLMVEAATEAPEKQ